jgi:hypothetical protein
MVADQLATHGTHLTLRACAADGWPRTMLTYTASHPLGPYTRATRNLNSLNGSCYYSRFLRGPKMEILVTHQTWTCTPHPHRTLT